jgi:hypothetical protein
MLTLYIERLVIEGFYSVNKITDTKIINVNKEELE